MCKTSMISGLLSKSAIDADGTASKVAALVGCDAAIARVFVDSVADEDQTPAAAAELLVAEYSPKAEATTKTTGKTKAKDKPKKKTTPETEFVIDCDKFKSTPMVRAGAPEQIENLAAKPFSAKFLPLNMSVDKFARCLRLSDRIRQAVKEHHNIEIDAKGVIK